MALAEIDVTPDALPLDSIICGDCLSVLRTLPDNSIDAIVTDPPAGISFMGKGWDSDKGGRDAWIAWLSSVMAEALRVLKPGGHALVWALPRTSHWTAMALEDAGFEVRDCVTHLFGSGFPKSLDVSKAIDKAAGAHGSYGGPKSVAHAGWIERGKMRGDDGHEGYQRPWMEDAAAVDRNAREYLPATDAARAWDGWGTALKPAAEFWWLCRKPLAEGTVAANVLTWGTGALNIGVSRVAHHDDVDLTRRQRDFDAMGYQGAKNTQGVALYKPQGRWPANLLLSHSLWCDETACALDCPIRALDAQSGIRTSGSGRKNTGRGGYGGGWHPQEADYWQGDTGGASRYFSTFRPEITVCVVCRKNGVKNATRLAEDTPSWIAPSAVLRSSPSTQASNTALDPAQAKPLRASAGKSQSKSKSAHNAASPSANTPAMSASTAPSDAWDSQVAQIVRAAQSAVSLCDACATAIAQRLAPMPLDHSPASRHGRESMQDANVTIRRQSLASAVALLASNVTIPTTTDWTMWFGFAAAAISMSTTTVSPGELASDLVPFLYQSKASRSERNRGCEALPERIGGTMNGGHMASDGRTAEWGGRIPATNHHPCVKPQMLMSWLIGLITPPGGIVLDPFAGSGSTLCAAKAGGWRYIGIEKEPEYVAIAHARVQAS